MPNEVLKIYPSSAAFLRGQGVITEYNSGCLRFVVANKGLPKRDIDPRFMEVGLTHENRHAESLGNTLKAREEKFLVIINDKVSLSGRFDFLTTDNVLHETKASLSKNFRLSVIRKGKVKLSHLAQTVCYMLHLKIPKAMIVTGFYLESQSPLGKNIYTFQEGRNFNITLDSEGRVLVEGEDSGYTVSDQYKHTLAVAEVLVSEEIKDRPINHVDYSGPCFFCPLKKLCSNYDKGHVTATEFKEQSKIVLTEIK